MKIDVTLGVLECQKTWWGTILRNIVMGWTVPTSPYVPSAQNSKVKKKALRIIKYLTDVTLNWGKTSLCPLCLKIGDMQKERCPTYKQRG